VNRDEVLSCLKELDAYDISPEDPDYGFNQRILLANKLLETESNVYEEFAKKLLKHKLALKEVNGEILKFEIIGNYLEMTVSSNGGDFLPRMKEAIGRRSRRRKKIVKELVAKDTAFILIEQYYETDPNINI
jgi:hypothetical protein